MARPGSIEYGLIPPPHVRLVDYTKDKFDTPTDERGLVVVPELIDLVKATLSEEWDFVGDKTDVHHFYWPERDYKYSPDFPKPHPSYFRNLPIHKGLVPRSFHTWLHLVSLPPATPTREVMSYRIEAYNVTKSLFKAARETIHTQRMARRRAQYIKDNPQVLRPHFNGEDIIGREIMQEILEINFEGYQKHLKNVERLPREFMLVDFESFNGPIDAIATSLGKLVSPRALNLVGKISI